MKPFDLEKALAGLFMADKKKKGWVNIYKEENGSNYIGGEIYDSEEIAALSLVKFIHKCKPFEERGFTQFSSSVQKVTLFKSVEIEWEE